MDKNMILLPLFAQVLLTAIVWCWMYYTRLKEISDKKIVVQELSDKIHARELLKSVAGPSDNLSNLFEIPVLFFMAIIVLYVTQLANYNYLIMTSIYVGLRWVHSLIHISYNNVMQRFTAYFISTILLWVIWGMMAVDIFLRG